MVKSARKPATRLRAKRITSRAKIKDYLTIVTHLIVKIKGNFLCVRCKKQFKLGDKGLTASHFWNSTKWKTRWVFDNIDPVCWGCHSGVWEHNKQGEYRLFKLKQLGQTRYDELERMAYSIAKWQEYELKDMLEKYIMILLSYHRNDVQYKDGTLSIYRDREWKKLFHYVSGGTQETFLKDNERQL